LATYEALVKSRPYSPIEDYGLIQFFLITPETKISGFQDQFRVQGHHRRDSQIPNGMTTTGTSRKLIRILTDYRIVVPAGAKCID
jgi:hypothetical protein